MPSPLISSRISVVDNSGNLAIDALLGARKWGGPQGEAATVRYSFPDAGSVWSKYYSGLAPGAEATNGFAGLDDTQKIAVRAALQVWSDVANIRFVEVAETSRQAGDIRIAFSAQVDEESAEAYTYNLGFSPAAGDIWISPSYRQNPVSSDFQHLLQHEIGHALGLKHPFDSHGSRITLPGSQDSLANTLMSYRAIPGVQNAVASQTPTTAMAYDIRAIQYLYGANRHFHAGDDTYAFLPGQDYYECVWDAGGQDTFDYSASSIAGTIDLRPGHWSQFGNPISFSSGPASSTHDTVSIAYRTSIENAIGGSGDDTLIGNNARNTLDGRAGNDTMQGGRGNDIYLVDSAADVVQESASSGRDKISTTLSSYTLGENLEILEFTGSSNFSGSGNRQANVIIGSAGNDTLDGQAGKDRLNGGPGDDTYIIDHAGDSIIEALSEGTDQVSTSLGAYTLPRNVENLIFSGTPARNFRGTGNALDNSITGGSGDGVLQGRNGNDTLDGGTGRDMLLGGKGDDVLIYDPEDVAANRLSIIGGTGTDTLKIAGAAEIFDFSQIARGRISGIEKLDLTGSGDNQLLMNEANLFDLTGPKNHSLTVLGNAGDSVTIAAADWSDQGIRIENEEAFHYYTHGADQLLVQADLLQYLI